MNQTISEYSPDVLLPRYRGTDYSTDLEIAVLTKKNQTQQTALNTLSNLEHQSLNISMLNLEGKQRLDAYNKEIRETLSGDVGDLTKIENQNRVANLFQKVSTDRDLINASKLSQKYQAEYDTVQRLKSSGRSDSGYNFINEAVWMQWDGGYYDFMQKSLGEVNSPNFRPATYTPFKDLRIPLANLTKLLHEDVVSREQQTVDKNGNPTGYLTKHIMGGVSPERVKALFEEQLGADGVAQIEVMSKYEILKARNSGAIDQIYNQYKAHADNELLTYEAWKSEKSQQLAYNNEKLKNATITDEEKAKITEENLLHQRNLEVIEANITNLKSSEKSQDDFMKMSNSELLPYVYQVQKNEKVKDAVNALSWKRDVQELSPDATYLAAKKIDAMNAQLRFREEAATNRLKLSASLKMKAGKAEKEGTYSVGDITKNEVELLSSYNRLTGLQEQYAKKTDNIIAAPSFDDNSLKAGKWDSFFEKNKDNYYVQMWDVFKNTHPNAYDVNGNPNKEVYRLWLQDEEKNPSEFTKNLVNQNSDDKFVAEYLTGEMGAIDGLLRANAPASKELIKYARDVDGNAITEEQFLKGDEVFIWFPTMKKGLTETDEQYRARGGQYQKKPLTDLIYDYTNAKEESSVIDDGRFKTTVTNKNYGYLANDVGLLNVISNYTKSTSDPILLKTLEDRLVQYQQFNHVQTSDKDEIEKYAGLISSAAKNQSDQFRTLFSAEGIEVIALPTSVGEKGLVKFKKDYAKTLNEAGVRLPTADGNQLAVVEEGKAYLWDAPVIAKRDALFNLASQKRPYSTSYKGYKIEINPFSSGQKGVIITQPDGTKIQSPAGDSRKDLQEIINQTKGTIDVLSKQASAK